MNREKLTQYLIETEEAWFTGKIAHEGCNIAMNGKINIEELVERILEAAGRFKD